MRRAARVKARLAIVAAAALGLIAAGCSDCSLSVKTSTLPSGSVGVRYFSVLHSHCGGDVWFLQSGSLPPGIGLQDNGDIEGVPSIAGVYVFTVGVYDYGSGETAFKGLSITVEPARVPTASPTPAI